MTTPTTAAAAPGAGQAVLARPCPYRALAWWGDQLVADSRAAVRVEEPGRPPALYFPRSDVRLELFHDEGHRLTCPVKGGGRLWSIEGTVRTRRGAWQDAAGAGAADSVEVGSVADLDGRDALWAFSEPAAGLGWLADMAAFDHDRVRVELVDPSVDDGRVGSTTKRFPTWGDAADLIEIMDVRPDADGRCVSVGLADHRRPVVEGSQMLGQAVVAAGRFAPGRRAVSAHMIFYRGADAREPLEFELDELSSGRSFTTLAVHVGQGGRRRASGTLLLAATAPDLISHTAPPPPCPDPCGSEPYDMSVLGRDIRVADAAYTDDPRAPAGPPVIDAWVRFRDVPADPCLHAGLLAQFTGHMSIAAALRPHEGVSQAEAHRTLSMGINAIAISFHADVRADRWMRYHHLSTFAGHGMTHSECRVYGETDDLLASFTVDAMVRGFPSGRSGDGRTAM